MAKQSKVKIEVSIPNELKELIMGVKDDLAAFSTTVNAAITSMSTSIGALTQKLNEGTLTTAELKAVLDPIAAGLQTVATQLVNLTNPTIPPPEPL